MPLSSGDVTGRLRRAVRRVLREKNCGELFQGKTSDNELIIMDMLNISQMICETSLMNEFRYRFAVNLAPLGCTDLMIVEIKDLNPTVPI